MKTQILQLEAHDDPVSVRDKMSWVKAARIVLVYPPQERILNRRLDLVLLQRCGNSLGAQLGLVSTDPDVHFYAKELRIPVFNTLRQAQSDKWRVGRRLARRPQRRIQRRAPRPDLQALHDLAHPAQIAWVQAPATRRGFYALTLFMFLAVAAIVLPGAEIHLVPETRTQEITLAVTASTGFRTPNLSGELPARPTTIVVEGRDSIPTSRTVSVPELSASGRVQFTNLTGNSITIPEGTIVSTIESGGGSNLRFTTTRAARIPAGVGTTLSLPVRALSPGKASNLAPGKIQAIEGPLGLSLTVTNVEGIKGGTDRQASSPGEVDYQRLYEKLAGTLRQAALLELETILPEGSFPITTTLALSQTLEQVYDPPLPPEGMDALPAEQLHLRLQLEFTALVVQAQDLQTAAVGILGANLSKGFIPVPATLELQNLSLPSQQEEGLYQWLLRARQTTRAEIPESFVLSLVSRRSPRSASQVLYNSLQVDGYPQISLSPTWWPYMPVWSARIKIQQALP